MTESKKNQTPLFRKFIVSYLHITSKFNKLFTLMVYTRFTEILKNHLYVKITEGCEIIFIHHRKD